MLFSLVPGPSPETVAENPPQVDRQADAGDNEECGKDEMP